MKRILIPTDFSPVADNALNYAIEIAAKFKSELILCHVFTFNRKIDHNWDYPYDEQPYILDIKRKMDLTKLKFRDKINKNSLSIKSIVEEGNVLSIFSGHVTKQDVDLIVMGTKGAEGFTRMIFGSTAADAIDVAEVPMLIVPPTQPFISFEKIVFAADMDRITKEVASPLQKIAFQFKSKVTIANYDTDLDENMLPSSEVRDRVDVSLNGIDIDYSKMPATRSVNDSINQFLENDDFHLLCMINRKIDFFKSFFEKSITKIQVYSNHTPLLVLPES